MRRLTLKLSTALQTDAERAIFFHEGGTSQFVSPARAYNYYGLTPDEPSGRIWALIDANQFLSQPAPCFRAGNPFFVVEVASRQSRFEWANKVHHQHFYMRTWTFSEVLQVYVALPPEVHNAHDFCRSTFLGIEHGGPYQESQLKHLYETYRAPPRALGKYAGILGLYENRVAQKVEEFLPHVLRNALSSPDSDESTHLIVRMEPDPKARDKYRKTIASRYILELLWDRHLKGSVDGIRNLYIALQGSTVTASAVGGILELWIHQLFTSKKYPLKLYPPPSE